MAKISGIECVGVVRSDPTDHFRPGQTVAALMGGMGRTRDGSYAEYTRVPLSNVTAIESTLPWAELTALPESYATAWTCLHRNLDLRANGVLLIRGATSALGQAAVNIAAQAGAHVIATTRNPQRLATLRTIGAATTLLEGADVSKRLREVHPNGAQAVLDLIGTSTLLDSLQAACPDGLVCMAGFLGGGDPILMFNPLTQMPSCVHLSFFASAFTFGLPGYPLTDIPFQTIVDRVAKGTYRAQPAKVYPFSEIQDAHRWMESNGANGKIVVVVDEAVKT